MGACHTTSCLNRFCTVRIEVYSEPCHFLPLGLTRGCLVTTRSKNSGSTVPAASLPAELSNCEDRA